MLVKGGDLEGGDVIDVYFDGADLVAFVEPRIDTTSTHGSGCALASAIAAGLARGESLLEAARGQRPVNQKVVRRLDQQLILICP